MRPSQSLGVKNMEAQHPEYPVQFDVDYPKQPRNRLTTFFRLVLVIPILLIFLLLAGLYFGENHLGKTFFGFGGGLLFLPPLIMILFRKKYPRWWFNWNLEFFRFQQRIISYIYLLRDEYPSTDEQQAVHLTIEYPESDKLNRALPLVKWFLAIPHVIILAFLGVVALVFVIIAWFAILFTGKYPRSLFNFVVGVMRWSIRVTAYAFLLTTDQYPPFSLD
jgi:hypothetical protein